MAGPVVSHCLARRPERLLAGDRLGQQLLPSFVSLVVLVPLGA